MKAVFIKYIVDIISNDDQLSRLPIRSCMVFVRKKLVSMIEMLLLSDFVSSVIIKVLDNGILSDIENVDYRMLAAMRLENISLTDIRQSIVQGVNSR